MAFASQVLPTVLSHDQVIREALKQYLPGYKVFVQEEEGCNSETSISIVLTGEDRKQFMVADLHKKEVRISNEKASNQELYISSKNSSLATPNNKLRFTFSITDSKDGHYLATAYMPESPSEGEKLPLEFSQNITPLLKLPSDKAVFSLVERILPNVLGNTSSVDSSCNADWILNGNSEGFRFSNLDSEMHYNYWKLGASVGLTRIYGHALAARFI